MQQFLSIIFKSPTTYYTSKQLQEIAQFNEAYDKTMLFAMIAIFVVLNGIWAIIAVARFVIKVTKGNYPEYSFIEGVYHITMFALWAIVIFGYLVDKINQYLCAHFA